LIPSGNPSSLNVTRVSSTFYLQAGWNICGSQQVLDRLYGAGGLPQSIVVDNGPEFAGRTLDAWAYARGITLRFVRPGNPVKTS
jgi:transposase InsO family protein